MSCTSLAWRRLIAKEADLWRALLVVNFGCWDLDDDEAYYSSPVAPPIGVSAQHACLVSTFSTIAALSSLPNASPYQQFQRVAGLHCHLTHNLKIAQTLPIEAATGADDVPTASIDDATFVVSLALKKRSKSTSEAQQQDSSGGERLQGALVDDILDRSEPAYLCVSVV